MLNSIKNPHLMALFSPTLTIIFLIIFDNLNMPCNDLAICYTIYISIIQKPTADLTPFFWVDRFI